MGTIADKIQYTIEAIEDIKKALASKGVNVTGVALRHFGDLIRNLQTNAGVEGVKVYFPDYTRTTHDYYSAKVYEPILNITTGTNCSFTNDIIKIEEE